MHHQITIAEGVASVDDVSGGSLDAHSADVYYEVLRPLIKQGRTWEPGEHIQLERSAAERFIREGDIKELT